MDDPLILEVLDRLDGAGVSSAVENLVLGALLDRMAEVVDGIRVERPAATVEDEPTPVRAYLESVAVTGFRGIGPICELRLQPGPGLTLVVGRNGSGKSSFAEAAEFALTGDSLRWSGKSQEWKSGWRNLHAEADPQVKVSMRVEGEREPRVVRVTWASDKLESAKTEVTIPGKGRHSLDSLGWRTPRQVVPPVPVLYRAHHNHRGAAHRSLQRVGADARDGVPARPARGSAPSTARGAEADRCGERRRR